MKKYFFLAAAAAMMLSACSFDRDLDYDGSAAVPEGPIPMALTATNSVSAVVSTRSNVNDIQATTLDPTSTAVTGVFILKRGGKTNTSTGLESYEKWNIASTGYAANATISTNTNLTLGTLYYPDSKSQELDIYAYTPRDDSFTTTAGTDISSTAATVTIKADQSTKANYLLSDVLWGCVGQGTNGGSDTTVGTETATNNNSNAEIDATQYLAAKQLSTTSTSSVAGFVNNTGEIIIPMFHKAAKIIVKITPTGMDVAKLEGATVNFYVNGALGADPSTDPNVPTLSTTLNVYTGTITPLTPASTPIMAPIKFTDRLGQDESSNAIAIATNTTDAANGTNGVISSNGTDIDGYACSGIILPQTIKAGQKLIEIVLSDGTTYAYTIPSSGSDAVFLSTKVYTYTIALTASSLVLTTTVADWDNAASTSGSAVLQ